MSTETTQTLFRFTSLRNPELVKTKENYGFINRPKFLEEVAGGGSSFFDKILEEKTNPNETKLTYLVSRAKEFKNQPNYVSTIEDLGKIIDIEYFNSIDIYDDGYRPVFIQLTEGLNKLWDNLIYQVLTEESFYLKEKIVEILKKNHYNNLGLYQNVEGVIRPNFSEEEIERRKKQAREAKIVLPEELFVESSSTKKRLSQSAKSNVFEIQELKQKAEKELALSKAKAEKVELEQLKNELTKAQKDYDKGYNKALKQAQDAYQKSISKEQESYNLALLEAEANLPTDATNAQLKLAQAKVSKPNFPTFNFQFKEQLDNVFLKDKLSSETLETLVGVIGLSDDFEIEDGETITSEKISNSLIFDPNEYETLSDVLLSVEEKIKKQEELIIANTEVEKEQFVNIGGIFLPVNEKVSKLQLPEDYILCTKEIDKSYRFNIDFSFYVPDQSFIVKNIAYSISDAIDSYTLNGTKYSLVRDENQIKLTNLQTENLNDFKVFPIDDLLFNLKVNFTNGLSYDFTDISIVLDGCTRQIDSIDDGFIPSGFGVRRLGIADYLKVEQSTHAYVPGEVANIENIMAREYREKSTRRTTRTEDTTTTSSETEREQLTDTTTATRFDMQTEIAKMMAETTDVSTSVNSKLGKISIGASFAHNRSKDESSRTAVTQAKDITERALDRIVSKVKEERVRKIVEEFEENNTHGFDNRKGDKNVVGVYRWVDKVMKNQIFNYGKRMMFEFMIPQPSKIHRLAMMDMNPKKIIEKPVDPRTYKKGTSYNLEDFSKISPFTLQFWGAYYNVDLPNYSDEVCIGKAFSFTTPETGRGEYDEVFAKDDFIEIPEGYKTTKAKASISFSKGDPYLGIAVTVGDKIFKKEGGDNTEVLNEQSLSSFENSIPVSISQVGLHAGNVNVEVKCVLTDYGRRLLFNQIISAYEEALKAYEQKVKDAEEEAITIKETNANFYRQIESDVLKHNCMAYLVDPDKLGSQLYTGNGLFDFSVQKNQGMDDYASLVKFMEQAFEWSIMSYDFYPYYWGSKTDWQDLYQSESIDPLFRSFLQSGMARVIVTVKPGFEDAVQFYISTGKIWNGGEVPVIGDPMYISIVEEMREPTGEKVGKFWLTKLPTSLNILQAESIGLTVEQALPFTKENAKDCENPEMIVEKISFTTTKSLLNGGASTGENSETIVEVEDVVSGDWTDTTSVD